MAPEHEGSKMARHEGRKAVRQLKHKVARHQGGVQKPTRDNQKGFFVEFSK
jgi:hypothetical protein